MRNLRESVIIGFLILIIGVLVFLIIKKLAFPEPAYFVYPIP